MSDNKGGADTEGIVEELDSTLPEGVDRRKFLHGSLGVIGAGMFAGCMGDDGDGNGNGGEDGNGNGGDEGGNGSDSGDGDGGDDGEDGGNGDDGDSGNGSFQDDTEITFTTPWNAEPTHGTAHIAELEGYWEDEGVPGIDGAAGNGSDTESQNIGVGNKEMGIASFATAVSVWPGDEDIDSLDMSLVGMAKARPLLSLIWRTDELEDETDIAGKNVLLASGFAAATWSMYPELVDVDESEVDTEEAGEETGPPALANNDVQAIWGSIDLLPAYEAETDVELGVTPLTSFGAIPGFPIWVNNEWYENKEDNVEFVSSVLTGYYKALKWVLTNEDDYLQLMQDEVNTNLQTWTDEELSGQYQAFCAQAVNLEWGEEGIGYFTEEGVQTGLDAAGPALLDDPDMVPDASEMVITEPHEQAETVEFSDEEWDQLSETAGQYWDIFEEAESDN